MSTWHSGPESRVDMCANAASVSHVILQLYICIDPASVPLLDRDIELANEGCNSRSTSQVSNVPNLVDDYV